MGNDTEATSPESHVVNWFEIPVSDMDRAVAFYQAVFKKELTKIEMSGESLSMFPYHSGNPNATGALVKSESEQPSATGTMVYFTCVDLSSELSRVAAAGGKILKEKFSIGEHGFIAHFQDTEGNKVGMHSMT
jgi:uncharacterized protein